MYNNGLTDSELCELHNIFKLNLNMFLADILDSDLFQVEDKDDYYVIYPLFYCDEIYSDGDAIIEGSYKIVCSKTYQNIFIFDSETTIGTDKMYTIKQYGNTNKYLIFIYYQNTLEPCRNNTFTITDGTDSKQFITDDLGYCLFETDMEEFTVVLWIMEHK